MTPTVRPVEIPGEFGTLRGIWHQPEIPPGKTVPAVVMLHGFTGSHVENGFLFAVLGRRLASAGIAVLRADFYGSGDSDGEFTEATLLTEHSDARRMFEYALSQPGVDPARVGVLGFSMGGCVTALLIGVEPRIKSIVAWAPAIDHRLAAMLSLVPPPWNYGGLPIGEGFVTSGQVVKPLESLIQFRGPVLVVHGDQDQTVPLGNGALFAEKTGGKLVIIDGAGHTFDHPTWREQLFSETVQHFAQTLG